MTAQVREAACWLALLTDPHIRRRLAKQIIHACAIVPGEPLSRLVGQSPQEISVACDLPLNQAQMLASATDRVPALEVELSRWSERGLHVITRDAIAYPELLVERLPEEQLPYYLHYAGSLEQLTQPGVAIMGAVEPNAEASELTRALVGALAQRGHVLVGGYERGVDRLAAQQAHALGGAVVAIMPVGLDRMEGLLRTWQAALDAGLALMVSPYPMGQDADEQSARARWLLVAALCATVILVEPNAAPEQTAWAEPFRAWGGQILVWTGSEAESGRAWLEIGALPFADAGEATERLAGGATPAAPAVAQESSESAEELTPFSSPQEALDALSRLGRVPDKLRKRLEEDQRNGQGSG